jgi:hypothetical protein
MATEAIRGDQLFSEVKTKNYSNREKKASKGKKAQAHKDKQH